MSMPIYTLAKRYYPKLWPVERLLALVEAGRLTAEEYAEVTGEALADASE